MKDLIKKRILRALQVMALMVFTLVVFGNGCSQGGFSGSENNAGAFIASSVQCQSATDITVIPGAKTVSFVSSGQLLNHLSNCIGLAVPSDSTQTVYDEKKGSISTYGTANSITPPMMMAITSIAGEVCSDLIDQEIASGNRIFNGINLQAAMIPSSAQLSDAISNIALSCWRGNESNEERTILLDNVFQAIGASEANASRKAALMLCTSMLSSVNALLN
ncbi:MAG: hypothetical protein AABY64_00090 [Bdellovibrionota bacterium]